MPTERNKAYFLTMLTISEIRKMVAPIQSVPTVLVAGEHGTFNFAASCLNKAERDWAVNQRLHLRYIRGRRVDRR